MRKARLLRHLREKWDKIWALPQVKRSFVIFNTLFFTGVFYYPAIKLAMFPPENTPKKQTKLFFTDNAHANHSQPEQGAQEKKADVEFIRPQSA